MDAEGRLKLSRQPMTTLWNQIYVTWNWGKSNINTHIGFYTDSVFYLKLQMRSLPWNCSIIGTIHIVSQYKCGRLFLKINMQDLIMIRLQHQILLSGQANYSLSKQIQTLIGNKAPHWWVEQHVHLHVDNWAWLCPHNAAACNLVWLLA